MGYALQCALLMIFLLSIPISVVFALGRPIFKLLRQPVEVSNNAGNFLLILIPTTFLFGARNCFQIYGMVKKIVTPFTINSMIVLAFGVPLNYFLIKKIGYLGGAIATTSYFTLSFVLDGGYLLFSGACKDLWPRDGVNIKLALRNFPTMAHLGFASIIMFSEVWV